MPGSGFHGSALTARAVASACKLAGGSRRLPEFGTSFPARLLFNAPCFLTSAGLRRLVQGMFISGECFSAPSALL